MPTYAENAHRREIVARRRGADARDAEVHRAFDLMAQDKTPKSDRTHWAVVGEGSRAAQENYRRNYDRIFLSSRRPRPPSDASSARPGVVTAGSG